jgi:hypothetical protein
LGEWNEIDYSTLTLENPVTLQENDEIPIISFKAKQNDEYMDLISVDTEKTNFSLFNLNTNEVNITIEGNDIILDSIAYSLG